MTIKLSRAAEKRMNEILALYPEKRSAVMAALYIAQEELGSITTEALAWAGEKTGLAPVQVREAATFYTMYYKQPVGKYHLQICRTLSCHLAGKAELRGYIEKRLGIKSGQVSGDGRWSFEEVECLGSCGTAPVIQINDVFFEKLTVEKLAEIMDRIEKEEPNLRFSTVKDRLGRGLKGQVFSEVI